MSQHDPDGPKNLGKLFGDMNDYIRQHSRGELPAQKAKASEKPVMPHNVCRVCNKPFNHSRIIVERPIVTDPCPQCNTLLKDGFTALTDGSRFAFVKMPPTCADMVGMIVDLSKEEMDQVEKKKNEKTS